MCESHSLLPGKDHVSGSVVGPGDCVQSGRSCPPDLQVDRSESAFPASDSSELIDSLVVAYKAACCMDNVKRTVEIHIRVRSEARVGTWISAFWSAKEPITRILMGVLRFVWAF